MAKKRKKSYTEIKKERMYAKVDSWQGKLAGALAVLILSVQPLYINWDRYFGLTWHKFLLFVIYMVCAIIAAIIIWIYRASVAPRLLPRGKLTMIDWAVLCFAVVTVIAALFSPFREETNVWLGTPEPEGRYDGAITQLLYVAVYFIVSRWYKPKTRHFTIFGISAIIIALIGIFQFFGMDFLGLYPNEYPEYRVDNYYNIIFRSTLGNVNIVSTYVCIAILLSGFLFVRHKPPERGPNGKISGRWKHPLWLAASALSFWLMVLAGSDSGLVGTVAATFLAIPFIVETRKTLGRFLVLASSWVAVFTLHRLFYNALATGKITPSSLLLYAAAFALLLAAGLALALAGKEPVASGPARWKLGAALIVAILAVGLVGIEIFGKQATSSAFAGRVLHEAREILHGNIDDTFGTNRVYIWRNALKGFVKNPVIGSGPDTFKQAFPAEAHGFYGEDYDKAHNEYIQILVCQGIIGFLSYMIYLAGVFLKSIKKAFAKPFVMAVLAAFTGYCVQAFFNISVPIASQLFWVLAAMLANRHFRDGPLTEL